MLLPSLQETFLHNQFITSLLERCNKDFVLVKEIRRSFNADGYDSSITYDADYAEYDTLAEAVQNGCIGDILICRADYEPVSEEFKQSLVRSIDDFLQCNH